MDGQRETLIPSKLNHITLPFHQTNNPELKLATEFNALLMIVQ